MPLRVDADKPTPIEDLGITVGPGPVWIEQGTSSDPPVSRPS